MAKVYNFVGKFGSAGSGDGQFNTAKGIAVDANYIYVADRGNNRIQIFNRTTFAFVNKFGTLGAGNGQLNDPIDVAVDSNYIYVMDKGNARVQIFDKSTYAYVNKFSGSYAAGNYYAIAVDNDYIYFLSTDLGGAGHIETFVKSSPFTPTLNVNTSAGNPGDMHINLSYIYYPRTVASPPIRVYNISTGALVTTFATINCYGISTDANYIYALDTDDDRVEVYDISTYAFVEFFGSPGAGNGQFNNPTSIEVYNDIFYVNDAGNNRIQIFDFSYQTAPAAPSGLTAACGANRTIVLNWVDNS